MGSEETSGQANGSDTLQSPTGRRASRIKLEVGAAITLALATLGGVYKLGYSQGEKDLATYKTANELGLRETAKNLAVVNKEFLDDFKVYSENKKLREDGDHYKVQIATLNMRAVRAEKAKDEATKLALSSTAELAKLKGEETRFTIEKGKATNLPTGYIGYPSEGTINLNNRIIKVQAGSVFLSKFENKPCQIRVESVSLFEITIVFWCPK